MNGYDYSAPVRPVCQLDGCGVEVPAARTDRRFCSDQHYVERLRRSREAERTTREMNRLGIDPLDAYREQVRADERAVRVEAARAELAKRPRPAPFDGDRYIAELRARAGYVPAEHRLVVGRSRASAAGNTPRTSTVLRRVEGGGAIYRAA